MARNYWRDFTFSVYTSETGTRQFGLELWWHSSRIGIQVSFYKWEIHLMKERNG